MTTIALRQTRVKHDYTFKVVKAIGYLLAGLFVSMLLLVWYSLHSSREHYRRGPLYQEGLVEYQQRVKDGKATWLSHYYHAKGLLF